MRKGAKLRGTRDGAAVLVSGWNWTAVGVARAGREGKLTLGDRLVLKRRHGKRGEAESRRPTRAEAESAPLSFSARRPSRSLAPPSLCSSSVSFHQSSYNGKSILATADPQPAPPSTRHAPPPGPREATRPLQSIDLEPTRAHRATAHAVTANERERDRAGEIRLVQFGHIDHLRYRLVSTPDSQPPTSAYPTPNNNNPPQPDSVTDR